MVVSTVVLGGRGGGGCGGVHDRCGGNRVGPSGGSCRCGDLVASIHDCIVILQGWEFDHRFFDRIDRFLLSIRSRSTFFKDRRDRFDHGRIF